MTAVAASSLRVLARRVADASRDHVVDDQVQRVLALDRVLDRARGADDHRRAVVHRVVEGRAPRDQPVELGDA